MKKDYFKQLLAATALLLVAGTANAYDVKIDGIAYNLVAKAKQAIVTSGGDYTGSVVIPSSIESSGVTYDVTSIGELAFQNCPELTSVAIPLSVKTIGNNAFAGPSGLTSITIPSSVTDIGEFAFEGCSNLTSLNICEGVKNIECNAFSYCTGLTSIIIPPSLTSIMSSAFWYCTGLTSVTIKGDCFICPKAFYADSNLKLLMLHGNSILSEAFANCPELTDVYNYGNGSDLGYFESNSFEGSYIEYVTLHVPSELLSQAQSTEPWSKFGTITTIDPITYPTTASLTDGEKFDGYLKDADMTSISYTRTFNNTEWQALYLPFAMNYSDWSANFEVARINDVHQFDDDDDGTIDRTTLEIIKLKSGSTTEANTPYLIKAKSTGEKAITVSNTKLYRAQEKQYDVSSWRTRFNFCSTYSPLIASELNQTGYLVLSGGSLCPIDPACSGLSSYRWYLKVTDRDGNPKDCTSEVKLRVLDADGTTVLEEIEPALDANKVQAYDLSGRRVDSSKVRNGIYIINGKKVFVK